MCLGCYNTAPPAPAPPPAPMAQQVRFAFQPTPQDWTCYPSNQLQWIPPPPIVLKKQEVKKEEKPAPKEEPKKPKAKKAPSLVAGATYVYPLKSTYIHLIRDKKVWEKGAGSDWGFKMQKVPTSLSVGEYMEAVTGGKAEGMAVTEVIELGDGEWSKGTTVTYGSDKAAGTMASFGWNERRGTDRPLPPVWLVLNKA